jgi:mannosyltransferase OCH1-like enzyme
MLELDLGTAKHYLLRHHDLQKSTLVLRGKSLNASQTYYGQILDEFLLNETPPRVRPLLALPLPARVAALLELARAEPDNTAAATAFLIARRQAEGPLRLTRPNGTPIPKRIIQIWDTPEVPEDIAAYRETWRTTNPDYECVLFDAASADTFLAAHYPPQVQLAYRRARGAARKADIFRLAALLSLGGVYADADDRCQRPLATILPPTAALVLYQEHLGTLGNNFIAVAPQHPFVALMLRQAVNATNRGDSDIVWLSTGPALTARCFVQCYAAGALPGETIILDRRDLYRAIAIHCDAAYKKRGEHWSQDSFMQKQKR